ncbi:MAG TPA: TonB-dependent receptor, partial [Longimicrobiaceae bacterium]|nr:TonB-dependent receptor [Longimicrobiaceae bacterium]
VQQLLLSVTPQVQASVGTAVFNPLTPTAAPVPLASANIMDIPGIRESNTNTYEVGYKGILARRLLLAADLWYSQKDNFISPLTVSTPLIVMDPTQLSPVLAQLAPTLVGMFMQAGLPLELAQQQAQTLLTGVASVPVGVISSEQVASEGPALMVTYRNFGEVDLYGMDLSATALLTDQFTLTLGASFVNDDHFVTEGQVIALNAPKRKGTLALGYRNDGLGFTGEARMRYNAQFPVNSGVYVGMQCIDPNLASDLGRECVESYTLMDLTLGYRLPQVPGTSIQLMVQNLTDRPYQSFVGVPQIGRMALLRLRYEF